MVALSEALCIPYLKAHDFLGKQGRKNGGRTPDEVSQAAYQGAGLVLMEDFLFRNTLRTALKKLKAFGGRWILGRSGHLFAVIDGVIHDSELNSPRCLVDRVYYVWGFGNLDENDY